MPRRANAGAPPQAGIVRTGSSQPDARNVAANAAIPSLQPGHMAHTVTRGESVPSLARLYLPQTSFMTVSELEAAIRQANSGLHGNFLHPGEQLIIPGMLPGPISEHPISVNRDFEVRAIYLTGAMAGSEKGLRIINRWREMGGNSVVFDVKDSDGIVNIPFQHPLNSSGRRPAIRNLPKFAHYLHSLGMHSIARIAIFRDEHLVVSHPELAVRSRRSGQPWRENGKLVWTDPSHPEVQQYDIALAKAAAEAGVDEIQFDYVRFPAEGDQKDAQFLFQSKHPDWRRSDVITHFLTDAYAQIHPLHVLLSLDVFGVMAWQRPVDLAHTGQDIPAMALHCDVLSPMIYPSHFFGMDGYAHPGDAPEHFIGESMERFRRDTKTTGVVLRPWLQAFGWRTRTYSADYIITQVRVSREKGGIGFLFWNARNDYGKPLVAMSEMRAQHGKFFRGDELPGTATGKTTAESIPTPTSAPAAAR
ncbi:MAG TPA: putative glycoside hydrolase, partial [Terriglobales bacterium]|nr:putative glycoside hydrolase [Terriglobales bacterium]